MNLLRRQVRRLGDQEAERNLNLSIANATGNVVCNKRQSTDPRQFLRR